MVGDINESNACITDNQYVTLIDADSFQVLDHDVTPPEVYRCTVGKPEYTPPELQGMSFEEVERTIHHDRFALAVIIYQLLMEGRHPFSGVYSGGGEEPNYEDSISEGYFLYSRSRGVPLASLPRDHILWEALDERLRDLFVRCFDEGHSNPERRPSPREWAAALEETARSLSVCDSNPNHLYSTRQAIVPACPWCERKALTGLDSFPESQTSQAQPSRTRLIHSRLLRPQLNHRREVHSRLLLPLLQRVSAFQLDWQQWPRWPLRCLLSDCAPSTLVNLGVASPLTGLKARSLRHLRRLEAPRRLRHQ